MNPIVSTLLGIFAPKLTSLITSAILAGLTALASKYGLQGDWPMTIASGAGAALTAGVKALSQSNFALSAKAVQTPEVKGIALDPSIANAVSKVAPADTAVHTSRYGDELGTLGK